MPIHSPDIRHITALVAAVPVKKAAPIAKALVAGASVAIAVAIPLVSDGLNTGELLTVAASFLAGAFPTWVVRNTDRTA